MGCVSHVMRVLQYSNDVNKGETKKTCWVFSSAISIKLFVTFRNLRQSHMFFSRNITTNSRVIMEVIQGYYSGEKPFSF